MSYKTTNPSDITLTESYNTLLSIVSLGSNDRNHESDEEYANNTGLIWGILIVPDQDQVHVFVSEPHRTGLKISSSQTLSKKYLTFGHNKFLHNNCPTLFNKNNSGIKYVNLPDIYVEAIRQGTMESQLNKVVKDLTKQINYKYDDHNIYSISDPIKKLM